MAETLYGVECRFLHTCFCIIIASVCCMQFDPSEDGLQTAILEFEFKSFTNRSMESKSFFKWKISFLMHSCLFIRLPFVSRFYITFIFVYLKDIVQRDAKTKSQSLSPQMHLLIFASRGQNLSIFPIFLTALFTPYWQSVFISLKRCAWLAVDLE